MTVQYDKALCPRNRQTSSLFLRRFSYSQYLLFSVPRLLWKRTLHSLLFHFLHLCPSHNSSFPKLLNSIIYSVIWLAPSLILYAEFTPSEGSAHVPQIMRLLSLVVVECLFPYSTWNVKKSEYCNSKKRFLITSRDSRPTDRNDFKCFHCKGEINRALEGVWIRHHTLMN
jgi:hypothetical protein